MVEQHAPTSRRSAPVRLQLKPRPSEPVRQSARGFTLLLCCSSLGRISCLRTRSRPHFTGQQGSTREVAWFDKYISKFETNAFQNWRQIHFEVRDKCISKFRQIPSSKGQLERLHGSTFTPLMPNRSLTTCCKIFGKSVLWKHGILHC